MYRLFSSLFFRVAVVFALLVIGGLWFVAHYMTPEAVYKTASGKESHVFTHPAFVWQIGISYLIGLPFVYGVVRFVSWLTRPSRS